MAKKFVVTLVVVLGLILVAGLIWAGVMYLPRETQGVVTSPTFINPDWARLECAPTDAYESSLVKWLDQQDLFVCNGFTEECRMKIRNIPSVSCLNPFAPEGAYRICDINGNNCASSIPYRVCGGQETDWVFIEQGRSIKFNTGILVFGEDSTQITFEYKPWKLYRFVGGAKWIVNSANCDITSSTKARIRDVDYPGSRLYRTGGEGQKWTNYINAWNYGPPTNVFTYRGGEVYCNAAKIYEIVKLEIADNTLKKINPTYSDTLPNGEPINGMGSLIKNVECCPNEPNCNDDFEYEEEEDECFTDAQCLNAGGPIPVDGTHYIYERCTNGECEQFGPVQVECTNDAICVTKYGGGYVCDLSTTNYGVCIQQIPGGYCGDGICDSLLGETTMTCPADCVQPDGNECSSCFTWLFYRNSENPEKKCEEATVWELGEDKPWYNPSTWFGVKITQKEWCPVYLIGIGSVILIVLTIIFVLIWIGAKSGKKPKSARMKR